MTDQPLTATERAAVRAAMEAAVREFAEMGWERYAHLLCVNALALLDRGDNRPAHPGRSR